MRKATVMEVKIGVQNVAREITLESSQTPEEVAAAVGAALQNSSVLMLVDEHGRQVLVPAAVLGYVQIGETEKRGVGFGNL
jgi:hypothetical protein